MKKSIGIVLLFVGLCFCFEANALDEKQETLSVSVEVAPTFGLSLDGSSLSFGSIKPGQSIVLGEDNYYNELRCRSNYGRTWFVKAQLLTGLKLADKNYYLPVSALAWKVVEANSTANPLGEHQFQKFDSQPSLIYISQGDDNKGKEVVLRFQYKLSCPGDAPGGVYFGSIVFTMTETP